MTSDRLVPSGRLAFGRSGLIQDIRSSLTGSAAALLFGGRMSGKTTTLLKYCETYRIRSDYAELQVVNLPVYVDLMRLESDAGPSQFWNYLIARLRHACEEQIAGFKAPRLSVPADGSLDSFELAFCILREAAGEVDLEATFLIDETRRLFGARFPHGLQDNLFTLLYGSESSIHGAVSMVFAGAQDLYETFIDGTSPIGSRASQHSVRNMVELDIVDLLKDLYPDPTVNVVPLAKAIIAACGGHAGMVRMAAAKFASFDASLSEDELSSIVVEFLSTKTHLMHVWNIGLSTEAAIVRDLLLSIGTVGVTDAASALATKGASRFLARRACEELVFTGVAKIDGVQVIPDNLVFWSFVSSFGSPESSILPEGTTWKIIEQAELELRQLVRERYALTWPTDWEGNMRKFLGQASWSKILANKKKSERQYPYSVRQGRHITDSMYMGQLLTLMENGSAWPLFESLFRDKRHAQDLFGAIIPVRNDHAHFSPVPDKELARCRVACDDLLVIIEKERAE